MIGAALTRMSIGLGVTVLTCFIYPPLAGIIICSALFTKGTALLILPPAFYVIGFVVSIWWLPFGGIPESETAMEHSTSTPHHDPFRTPKSQDSVISATRDYIRKQKRKGISRAEITESLQRAGWSKEFIGKQFEALGFLT